MQLLELVAARVAAALQLGCSHCLRWRHGLEAIRARNAIPYGTIPYHTTCCTIPTVPIGVPCGGMWIITFNKKKKIRR